ncbi:hypothetical protein BU25DRAFT_490168 [Macroventuria anomochaeta]|uniref:Uncharacterized protein n=1 Tax=Macroventuria anomochaeta TaxID=301207 RepID=A0ACB6S7D8_9PLEO|nr:uncharacterized protein BU25DRAFT_490168 [Macroventuria anomochaeta]KAF2629047.1 hypothetical protein BU25DRAFT_490168 [Macroventuria anomochaeta]
MAEASTSSEDIAHDDICPICQLLLFTPVRTRCNHLLCASCMAQWADASTTNQIEHSSWDVDLADFDPNYDPIYDLEANCPMCRTHIIASPDHTLAKQLEVGQNGVEGVMILIGNKHRLIRGGDDANQHDWTFFVRTSRSELIEEVRVKLHPPFRPPRVVLRCAPYEVRRLGWGYFTLTLETEIIFKAPYIWVVGNSGTRQRGLELTWTLDFEDRGRQGRVRAKVKKLKEEGGLRLRTRPVPTVTSNDDDDDEEDYESNDENENLSEDEEEDTSVFVETPGR